MAKIKNPFRRIRLVYRRSPALLKYVVLGCIALATATVLALGVSIYRTQQQAEELRLQAARLQEENQQLQQDIDEIGTIDSIKRIASEELGLVEPGAEIFEPEENQQQP